MTQVEPDTKSGIKSETKSDMRSDTKTARNVPSRRSFTPEELQALTSSSFTAEEVEAMQAQLDKCHAADGMSKLNETLQIDTDIIYSGQSSRRSRLPQGQPRSRHPRCPGTRHGSTRPCQGKLCPHHDPHVPMEGC